MALADSIESFGVVTRLLHWLIAAAIVVLFASGVWMVELDYTSAYYTLAPAWHEALGMLVLFAMVLRIVWRFYNVWPSNNDLSALEKRLARMVHWGMYLAIMVVAVSGYLISTADGRAISLFGLIDVPSLLQAQGIETPAGKVHRIAAYVMIALAAGHTVAALKHHFVDRKPTLKRMWRG